MNRKFSKPDQMLLKNINIKGPKYKSKKGKINKNYS